jgi:hypothetical protein
MSTWTIKEANTDKELGIIENKIRFVGSEMTANGAFGHYTIEGKFGNHEFTIKKDGQKVRIYILIDYKLFLIFNFYRLLRLKRRNFIYMIHMVYLSMVMLIELLWYYLQSLSMKFENIKQNVFFPFLNVCICICAE